MPLPARRALRAVRSPGRFIPQRRYQSQDPPKTTASMPVFRAPHLAEDLHQQVTVRELSKAVALPQRQMAYVQEHENDPAAMCIVHYPGAEMVFGSFHPMGSLYHQSVSITKARAAVKALVATLARNSVEVLSIGDILRIGTELDDRHKLEEFAMSSLTYETTATSLTAAEANLLSMEYKRKAVEQLDTFDLVDAIITRPTLTLEKSTQNTPLASTAYNFSPLTNLVFTRDQQVITAAGVVLSQLHSKQRSPEVHLIRFCLEKLGIPILGQVPPPGKLEGGDFIPAGRELCFIGLGIRTNARAISYMLQNKWFGTERVAVVKDLLDRKQARMHLDCVFNIIADDVVVLMDSIGGHHTDSFRLVDEYTLIDGTYQRTQENVEFLQYLNRSGFNVIRVTDRMHTNYGCNFINCGDSRLITCDAETADFISRSPAFRGTIDNIDFSEITKLYGALHCSTQVFRERRPDRVPLSRPAEHPLTLASQLRISPAAQLPPIRQTTNTVLVVAPTYFAQNPETFQDNAFMQSKAAQTMTSLEIVEQACACFSKLYKALVSHGVNVKLYHHESYHETPDAVFPNNWFSTHSDGQTLVLYPMKYPSRQRERRRSIVTFLKSQYPTTVDLTVYESDEDPSMTQALEGTGALVLDRVNKVAFCALSQRADEKVLEEWCHRLGYQAVPFRTTTGIYHTNVMMAIGTTFALVCVECIVPEHRARVVGELKKCGKAVIRATEPQMNAFLCNCLEVRNDRDEKLLFMSKQAHDSLSENQMYYLLHHVDKVVKVEFGIIERVAGGGIRCALAELF